MNWNKRLVMAMQGAGISKSELARKVGVSAASVTDWCKGKIGELKAENAEKICRALDVDLDWLLYGKGVRKEAMNPDHIRSCPVVGTAQLGDNGHYCEIDYPPGQGDGSIAWHTADENAYAIRCRGDSMSPRIRDGEYVIVEPNHPPIPGDEVLVKTADDRVMVKILLYQRDGKTFLGSINDSHPVISIPTQEIDVLHYVGGLAKPALWMP